MPLRLKEKVPFYYSTNHNEKGIADEVLFEEVRYPVNDLCHDGKFEAAHSLIKKGHCFIHGDAGIDFLGICSDIIRYSNRMIWIAEEDRGSIGIVLGDLRRECNALGEFAVYEIAQDFVDSVDEQTNPKKLLQMIRKHFSPIYSAILNTDTGLYRALLACRDEEFTNDYLEKIIQEEKIAEFVEENELCDEDARDELLQLMDLSTVKSLEEYSGVLYELNKHCKGLFPRGFTCDVAIVAAIKELRIVTRELVDECYIAPDSEQFAENDSVRGILSRLNRLLKFHMPAGYSLDRVAEVIIEYCGMYGMEYDLEPEEIPQNCDYLVLDEVLRYAKRNSNITSIKVSESVLEDANIVWDMMHGKDKWRSEYKVAKPEIGRLTDWFYSSGIVLPMFDDEGEPDSWEEVCSWDETGYDEDTGCWEINEGYEVGDEEDEWNTEYINTGYLVDVEEEYEVDDEKDEWDTEYDEIGYYEDTGLDVDDEER